MKSISTCPICQHPSLLKDQKVGISAPHFKQTSPLGFMTATFVRYSLCPRCGVYIQTPRMTDDDIRAFYGKGLYREWLNMEQKAMDDDEKRRAQLDATIVRDYIQSDIQSHLDIGASRGFFLDEVDARFKVGVEPNTEYVTQPKISIYPDLALVPNTFDLVSALHSMEHSIDPNMFLLEASLKVKQGGRMVIEVPSEQSPGGWPRLAHTFHYPPWTLHYMAEKIGWQITYMLFTPHTLVIMERKQS